MATGCGGLRLHPAVGEGCRRWRGTGSSNPSPSSGESPANLRVFAGSGARNRRRSAAETFSLALRLRRQVPNAGWTIERIPEDAARIGPATPALCEQILDHRPHPEQGLSRCLGIVRLARPVVILATGPRTAMPPKEIAHVGVP